MGTCRSSLNKPTCNTSKRPSNLRQWSVNDVHNWLSSVRDGDMSKLAQCFKKHNIDGKTLQRINTHDLDMMNINTNSPHTHLLFTLRDRLLNTEQSAYSAHSISESDTEHVMNNISIGLQTPTHTSHKINYSNNITPVQLIQRTSSNTCPSTLTLTDSNNISETPTHYTRFSRLSIIKSDSVSCVFPDTKTPVTGCTPGASGYMYSPLQEHKEDFSNLFHKIPNQQIVCTNSHKKHKMEKQFSAESTCIISECERPIPYISSHELRLCPSNEIENDEMSNLVACDSLGNLSLDQCIQPKNRAQCDLFQELGKTSMNELREVLRNEEIIYDSLLKMWSQKQQKYISFAGALTENRVVFINAIAYNVWNEFKIRSKIDTLVNAECKNENEIINDELAAQMIANMDLLSENKYTNMSKMTNFVVNKTKKQIKSDILFSENKVPSLASLFDIHCRDTKETRQVIIKEMFNKSVISADKREDFVEFILEDIPFIDQERNQNALIITLQKYYSTQILSTLNDRCEQYFQRQKCQQKLGIFEYNFHAYNDQIFQICDLSEFTTEVFNSEQQEKGYVFILKNDRLCNDITCLVQSNNIRHSWLTHLDSVMHKNVESDCTADEVLELSQKSDFAIDLEMDCTDTDSDDEMVPEIQPKLMLNDFTSAGSDRHEFTECFSFGHYLCYWLKGEENSVTPKYPTLKYELLHNNVCKVSKEDYYQLYTDCLQLLKLRKHRLKAANIGINNKKFNVAKGSEITINHLIALKLYTDFSDVQREFKKHCRISNEYETLADLVRKNREIFHWCRYLKESCTFFGNLLKCPVYSGLKKKLIFHSMTQRFECMLSTSSCVNIASNFKDDEGIVVKLRAANTKTRYFDCSWLSHYEKEWEKLLMGSSVKICDIYINGVSSRKYIVAIQLFEQIIKGKFIDDTSVSVQQTLYELITWVLEGNDGESEVERYIVCTLKCIINKIKDLSTVWMNEYALQKINCTALVRLFEDTFPFFRHKYVNINVSKIHFVQKIEWNISGKQYKQFKNMKSRKYITSDEYMYKIDNNTEMVTFQLKCCSNWSCDSTKCALFLHLISLPKNIRAIKIEYELICEKKKRYKKSMLPQWLSVDLDKTYCGFRTFASKCLRKNDGITWILGIKILDFKAC